MVANNTKIYQITVKLPSPYNLMLATLASEDLRNKQNTVLMLINQEYLRRHPDGGGLIDKADCADLG